MEGHVTMGGQSEGSDRQVLSWQRKGAVVGQVTPTEHEPVEEQEPSGQAVKEAGHSVYEMEQSRTLALQEKSEQRTG